MKTSLIDDHYIWDDTDESPDDSKFDDYRQLYNYYGIREKGAIGLKNLKNTCFMNSSLQCLSHIQELYNKLKQYRKKGILTSHFYKMLYLMHETKNGSSFEPEDIFKEIYTRFPKYKKKQQQDANEFITNFLTLLNEELKSSNIEKIKTFDISDDNIKKAFDEFYFYKENISPIVDLFYGNFIHITNVNKSMLLCFDFSVFNMLELSIYNLRNKSVIDLESLIKENIKYSPLGIKEYCPVCKKISPSYFGSELLNLPDILIIFINKVINNVYYTNLIDFPNILKLSNYTIEDKNSSPYFQLIGIINHSGSSEFGHYTAECKNFIDDKWYYFNDSWVSQSKAKNEKERIKSSRALLLFYKRLPNS